jgi:hypothetical protein
MLASVCMVASVVPLECAAQAQPSAEAQQRLAALEACIERSENTVDDALSAGVSAGDVAPANSSLADAEDALDEGQTLLDEGKEQEAIELLTKAIAECNKIDAMIAQARQGSTERTTRAQMVTDAEGRITQLTPCLDTVRQTVNAASKAKAKEQALAPSKTALGNAEQGLAQARQALAQGDPKTALERLSTAEAECKTAQEEAQKLSAAAPAKAKSGRKK